MSKEAQSAKIDGLKWGAGVGVVAVVIGSGLAAMAGLTAGLVAAGIVASGAVTAIAVGGYFLSGLVNIFARNNIEDKSTGPFVLSMLAAATVVTGTGMSLTSAAMHGPATAFNDACKTQTVEGPKGEVFKMVPANCPNAPK